MNMRTAVRALAMLLAVFVASACAARTPQTVENDAEAAHVTVINRSLERVTIYVSRGAERVRLGAVSPGLDETFRIPSSIMAGWPRLRFTAETVGRQVLASTVETVSPGIHIEMIVR